MKRRIALFFAAIVVVSLSACGSVPRKPASAPNYAPPVDHGDRY